MKKISYLLAFISFSTLAQKPEQIGKLSPKEQAKVQRKIETTSVVVQKNQAPAPAPAPAPKATPAPANGIIVKNIEVKDGKTTVISEKKVTIAPKSKKKKIVKKK